MYFKIINEVDDSFLDIHQISFELQTISSFPVERLPPLARHEAIADPPSSNHTYDGSGWVLDLDSLKQRADAQVEERAKERINDIRADVTKAEVRPIWRTFQTNLASATTKTQINNARTTALGLIDALA